jgi:hypothetical protein
MDHVRKALENRSIRVSQDLVATSKDIAHHRQQLAMAEANFRLLEEEREALKVEIAARTPLSVQMLPSPEEK